jgi:hypothetical protein
MPNKKTLAKLVKDWCIEHDLYPSQRSDPAKNIRSSSSLAVAMEFLGELDADDLEYSTQRGGIGFSAYKHLFPPEISNKALTLRQALEMLPD